MTIDRFRCGAVLAPEVFEALQSEAAFECFKWNLQIDGVPSLCRYPLLVERAEWEQLAQTAEALAAETASAEAELLSRPALWSSLGIPWRLRLALARALASSGPRYVRFDFHPTADGLRITEGNIDVAGGFIDGSGVTKLFARHVESAQPAGDPAGALASALAASLPAGARLGVMHLTMYADDRQVALYLARRCEEVGLTTCLFDPGQLRHRVGAATAIVGEHELPLDAVFRFFPAEWLARLPLRTRWWRGIGSRTRWTNPASAVLTQSKRWPLVWSELSTPLPTWQRLLPRTHRPEEVAWAGDEAWVVKPALAHEGDRIGIAGVTEPAVYAAIVRAARRRPDEWVVQRRFEATPLQTPDGVRFPCIGVYVVDGRAAGAYARLATTPLIDGNSQDAVVLVEGR